MDEEMDIEFEIDEEVKGSGEDSSEEQEQEYDHTQEDTSDDDSDENDGEDEEDSEDIDYKALYESEKKQKEKISFDYKDNEKRLHNSIQSIAEIKGALEATGTGRITEDGKIEIYSKEEHVDIIEQLSNQKQDVKEKYEDGEIEQEEYIEQISSINAKMIVEEQNQQQLKKEQEKLDKQKKEEATATQTEKHNQLFEKLNKDFPNHNDTTSQLHSQMALLISEKPDIYGNYDYTKIENVDRRYLLAQEAYLRLQSNGKYSSKKKRNASMRQFSSFNDRGTNQRQSKAISDRQKTYVASLGIKNKADLKSIEKHVSQLNEGNAIEIDM